MKRVSGIRGSLRRLSKSGAREGAEGGRGCGAGRSLEGDEPGMNASGVKEAVAGVSGFRPISLASLRKVLEGLESENLASGVELVRTLRGSRSNGYRKGESLEILEREEDGNEVTCVSPFASGRSSTLRMGKDAKILKRKEWTLEDVFRFVVLRDGVQFTETDFGAPFQGAYICVPRRTAFSTLVDRLERQHEGRDLNMCFVFIDVLCGGAEEPEAVREAIRKFESFTVLFRSISRPKSLSRLFCVWEIMAAIDDDKDIHCIFESEMSMEMVHDFDPSMLFRCVLMRSKNRDTHAKAVLLGAFTETFGDAVSVDTRLQRFYNDLVAERVEILVEDQRKGLLEDDAKGWFATVLHHAGYVVDCLDFQTAALVYYSEALEIAVREMGEKNLRVARILQSLALCHSSLAQFDEALLFAEQALPIFQAKFGDSDETADLLNTLANLIMETRKDGDIDQAQSYYEQSLAIYRKTYGKEHPKYAMALNNAARALLDRGEYTTAISYCEQALAIRETALGSNHVKLALLHANIGEILRLEKRYPEASDRYDIALSLHWKEFGRRFPAIADPLDDVLNLLSSEDGFKKALEKFETVSTLKQDAFSQMNPEIPRILTQKALVLDAIGDAERSLVFYSLALAVAQQVYGEAEPEVANILEEMAEIFNAIGLEEQGASFLESAKSIRKLAQERRGPLKNPIKEFSDERARHKALCDDRPPEYI